MPFLKSQNNKKPDLNKNGTPRKHGDTVPFTFRLEPEYIEKIMSEAELAGISKSEMTRIAIHYFWRDDGADTSIKTSYMNKIRQKKRKEFEDVYASTGKDVQKIMTDISRIGNNINQIAKKANQGYTNLSLSDEVNECRYLVLECKEMLDKVTEMYESLREDY